MLLPKKEKEVAKWKGSTLVPLLSWLQNSSSPPHPPKENKTKQENNTKQLLLQKVVDIFSPSITSLFVCSGSK